MRTLRLLRIQVVSTKRPHYEYGFVSNLQDCRNCQGRGTFYSINVWSKNLPQHGQFKDRSNLISVACETYFTRNIHYLVVVCKLLGYTASGIKYSCAENYSSS